MAKSGHMKFLVFAAALALGPVPSDISESQAKVVAQKSYVCGSMDWQVRAHLKDGNEAAAANTRDLARASGCDEVRKFIGVTAP